jgi:hypothetical protein
MAERWSTIPQSSTFCIYLADLPIPQDILPVVLTYISADPQIEA